MGEPILIYGKSGCGKSRAMKNFSPNEILLVNVLSKKMPFKSSFQYVLNTRNYKIIKNQLYKMPCKIAVIDDAGYLQTSQFMSGHSLPKKGGTTFDLFNEIGDDFWNLILFIKEQLPEDVIVYIMMHEIRNDFGEVRARTIGKLIDEKICLEGMFTICLHCLSDGVKHYFKTQGDMSDIAKSPEEMFELEIPNDLKFVDDTIRKYWNMGDNENV